jgi:hypothetical protein
MKAAEPLNCDVCARRIGKNRTHYLTEPGSVLCVRCIAKRQTHGLLYPIPHCRTSRHGMFDHAVVFATRAAANHIIAAGGITVTHPDTIEHKRIVRARNEVTTQR